MAIHLNILRNRGPLGVGSTAVTPREPLGVGSTAVTPRGPLAFLPTGVPGRALRASFVSS